MWHANESSINEICYFIVWQVSEMRIMKCKYSNITIQMEIAESLKLALDSSVSIYKSLDMMK
jgi:hypothetical protein